MPEPLNPRIESWVSFLKNQVNIPDKNTVLFGHSIGAQTILRYLELLNENEKIGGVVMLAGWVHLTDEACETEEDKKIAMPWLETVINWEKIKTKANKFTAIFSDDDPLVPLSDSEIFKEKLNAQIVVEHNQGHFSGSDGVTELRSALNAILEMSEKTK